MRHRPHSLLTLFVSILTTFSANTALADPNDPEREAYWGHYTLSYCFAVSPKAQAKLDGGYKREQLLTGSNAEFTKLLSKAKAETLATAKRRTLAACGGKCAKIQCRTFQKTFGDAPHCPAGQRVGIANAKTFGLAYHFRYLPIPLNGPKANVLFETGLDEDIVGDAAKLNLGDLKRNSSAEAKERLSALLRQVKISERAAKLSIKDVPANDHGPIHAFICEQIPPPPPPANNGPCKGVLKASYRFNGTLAADQVGVPSLIPVDPLGMNGFERLTWAGVTYPVYRFSGAAEGAGQGGLILPTAGLISPKNYTVEMVFSLEAAQTEMWRKLIDVSNRKDDYGLYIDPDDEVNLFPSGAQEGSFTPNALHKIVMSTRDVGNNVSEVNVYFDGAHLFSAETRVMDLDNELNPDRLIHFFLDDSDITEEYVPGRIASLKVYDGEFCPQ
jgi:hypothetical protein